MVWRSWMICQLIFLRLLIRSIRRWLSRKWGSRINQARFRRIVLIFSEIGDRVGSLVTATMKTLLLKRPKILDMLPVLSGRFQPLVDKSNNKKFYHKGENQRTSSTSLDLVPKDLINQTRTRSLCMIKTQLPGTQIQHLNSTMHKKNHPTSVYTPFATIPGEASKESRA